MKNRKLPSLCNLLGTMMLILVIVFCLPLSLPRLMGYEIYDVVSGSMEPEIPVGSVIYVKWDEPDHIRENDIIAFWSGSSVVAHRVMLNRAASEEFVTKGDANAAEDLRPIPYAELVGRVVFHLPVMGSLMAVYTGVSGKVYALLFAACGVALRVLAGRLRERKP